MVRSIDKHKATSDCYYFFDANVWIFALNGSPSLPTKEQKYVDFFYKIRAICNDCSDTKIIMNSLLFSEILNTYLRKIAMMEFAQEKNRTYAELDYKKDYRNTRECKESIEYFFDDIGSYTEAMLFIDDTCLNGNPPIYLNKDVGNYDFNDFCYQQMCNHLSENKKVIFVTDDRDFKMTDLKILSLNSNLLS